MTAEAVGDSVTGVDNGDSMVREGLGLIGVRVRLCDAPNDTDTLREADDDEDAVSLADKEAEQLLVLEALGEVVMDCVALRDTEVDEDGEEDTDIDFEADDVGKIERVTVLPETDGDAGMDFV
jgi:hypothetical protein